MKKFFYISFILFAVSFLYAQNDFIKQGDFYFNKRNEILDKNKAIENINKAIENYQKAAEEKLDEISIYKLTKAIDFKYNYLISSEGYHQEKWDIFKSLIEKINKFCEKNDCNKSKYIMYSRAILTGRFGELMNVMEAASEGIAGKIKDDAEKLLKLDETFNNYAAYIILGRLHYKAPNIVFLLTWPDKKKSKEYLEKYLEKEPDSLTGIYYYADTLYELGEKEKANELYKKVLNAKPRKNFYYEDKKAIEEVALKFKNQ